MVIAFNIFYLAGCLVMASNVGNISRIFYLALRKTWDQMSDSSLNRGARMTVFIGQLPFWLFRLFFLVAGLAGGFAMLVTKGL